MEISEVDSRGSAVDWVESQGRKRELFVMETESPDGDDERILEIAITPGVVDDPAELD